MNLFILENGKPVLAISTEAWGRWFEVFSNRVVQQTKVGPDVTVSTVFLGIDHGVGSGKCLLFETLVLGGHRDGEQLRYETLGEAKRGHFDIVDQLKASI